MAFDPLASQSELFSLEQPGGQRPQQPQAPKGDRAKLLRLIPIFAAAAKGGPGALEGLLQGFQQADQRTQLLAQQQQQQQQQTDRQSMLDDRAGQAQAFTQQMQIANFDQKAEADRAALVQEFGKAVTSQELDDPEAVRALTQLYEARGRALGVRPGTFETTAMQIVKPSTMERRAAEKKVNALKGQFGAEKWMTEGAKFTHTLPGGRTVSFQELLTMAGMTPDPNAQQAPADDVPNTDYARFLARFARARGKTFATLTAEEEVEAKKVYGQADDRPRVNVVIGAGGVTPQQNQLFQTIAGAYERSPLVRAASRTIVLENAIKDIEKNPADPAAQLALAYSYIQALDTYQSAVREGELQNLGVLGTRLQQFALELNRVANEGAFLPPAVAKNIAQNAKQLVGTIKAGSESKRQEFRSRAQVSGVGEMWDSFVAGADGGGAPGGRQKPAGANPFRKK